MTKRRENAVFRLNPLFRPLAAITGYLQRFCSKMSDMNQKVIIKIPPRSFSPRSRGSVSACHFKGAGHGFFCTRITIIRFVAVVFPAVIAASGALVCFTGNSQMLQSAFFRICSYLCALHNSVWEAASARGPDCFFETSGMKAS